MEFAVPNEPFVPLDKGILPALSKEGTNRHKNSGFEV